MSLSMWTMSGEEGGVGVSLSMWTMSGDEGGVGGIPIHVDDVR